jgi:regulatory protein
MAPGRGHTSPEQNAVRVVRFDDIGAGKGTNAPVARLDATDSADPIRGPEADLDALDGLAPEAAPVAFFAPGDGPVEGAEGPGAGSVDGSASSSARTDETEESVAAPVALFDVEQLTAARDGALVAEFGPAARGRPAGRGGRSPSGRGSRAGRDRTPSGDWAAGRTGDRTVGRTGDEAADREAERAGDQAPGRRADRVADRGAGRTEDQAADRRAGRAGSRAAGRRADRAAGRAEGPSGGDSGHDTDPTARAREICLRLLTDRARTRQELAQALHRKGIPDDVAGSVLERFDEVGLIDDAAFAGQWVRSRHAQRGLARRAIAVELRRKGVADEVAGEALAEVDGESEERRARQLVDRKLRSLTVGSSEQRAVAGRRLVGMLARKGYGAGVAYRVVREALAELGADVEELDAAEPPDD